jgi:hypothetical protein
MFSCKLLSDLKGIGLIDSSFILSSLHSFYYMLNIPGTVLGARKKKLNGMVPALKDVGV